MTGTKPNLARSDLVQDALKVFPVNLTDFRVWDAPQTNLPGTSAADDLALADGSGFGVSAPSIETSELKAAGATTRRARAFIRIPAEYDAGETVLIRISAGMVTTVADNTATVDVEAYEVDREGGIGSDLCNTSATSINSLTFSDKDFTIDASGLSPGDWLDVRISVAVNDAASGTEVKARIGSVELVCDVKG